MGDDTWRGRNWLWRDPEQVQESLRQNNLIYGGLAALPVVNRQEVFRRRLPKSHLVAGAQVVGQLCAFIGVVAGFWHIICIAGVAMLAAGLAAVTVHSVAYIRLEAQDDEDSREAGNPNPGDGPGNARAGDAAYD